MTHAPRIAVTMGDPAGVGPEVLAKTLARNAQQQRAPLLVVGHLPCLRRAAALVGVELPLAGISNLQECTPGTSFIPVLDPSQLGDELPEFGQISATAGAASIAFVEAATTLALDGGVAALVTCPIHKEAVQAAGAGSDIGHQEMLARLTGVNSTATMLMTAGLRVAHLSTHKSLREACLYVTRDNVLGKLHLTDSSLRGWGLQEPRIAVAALNPHGGEGGLLGREEIDELAPAITAARNAGINASGPLPADSVFYRAIGGEFDAVLALYHDQGHIAIKVHDFHNSITATMGIPFVRTSVDHGTAFDIAGTGRANPGSLEAAIAAAGTLARSELRPFPAA